ncbi:hypothetical protein PQX77_006454 [Marasmius sp. AFHP31]|nr:hypothetical protein PQX77_006454 [Marasmius sp. AFHP31]
MAFIGQDSSGKHWSPGRPTSSFTIASSSTPSRESTLVSGGSPRSEKEAHQQYMTRPPNIYEREANIIRKYPVPDHWKAASENEHFGAIRRALFNTLCVIAFGHTGLERVWAHIKLEEEGQPDLRTECTQQLCDRFDNMIMVAGLLLATTAVFMTTPPPLEAFMDYNLRGPYACLSGSFGLLIGGIIVASVCNLVASKARPKWTRNVLFYSRFHIYCTLLLLSYPFVIIGTATMLLAFGVLTAIWSADDHEMKGATALLLILPVLMAFIFVVAVMTGKPEEDPNCE